MNRLLTFLFLFISFTSYSQEPFEGTILFKVSTKVKDHVTDERYRGYFQNKYGDSVRSYYKSDGSWSHIFYSKAEMGVEWRIYDRETNQFYAKWKGIDTVYYFNCASNSTELLSMETGPGTMILGRNCKSVKVVTYDGVGNETLAITYYFSGAENIPTHNYTGFKDGFLDQVYAISQSHFLRVDMDLKPLITSMEAIRIEPGAVGDVMFQIPTDLPRKAF